MKKKTLILGLDGATWDLLKPYAEKGYMPTLARLLKEGVHGELESTMPAMTAPSWTTFATGKHPGKHGIFDFMLPTDSLGNMKFATADDIRDKTIYELLKEQGYTPVLINLPTSWPPKLKDDITITSLLTQGDTFIYPASLTDEFPELQKYRLTPDESLRLKDREHEYVEDLLLHMEEQLAAVRAIYEKKPWDFFFYLFSHSDWVSHLMYTKLLEEDNEDGRRVFEAIDRHLSWFVEHLPEDANLVMMSDHGFKAYKDIFYFNRWLEKEGYLKTKAAGDEFRGAATARAKETDKIRATKKRINIGTGVFETLSKFPPLERFAKWTYHNVVKKYLPVHIKVNVGIDFSQTTVCFPKGSYITNAYINKDWVYKDGIVSREEYPKLLAEVVEKMRNIRDEDGNPVMNKVMTREEVYGNDDVPDQAPDIFFELNKYWLVGQFQSTNLFAKEIHNKHGIMGIFLGYGPDFAAGSEVSGLKMQDMTPLLLHLLGEGVPEDCDGVVNRDVFATGSTPADQEPQKASASKQQSSEKDAIANALGNISI